MKVRYKIEYVVYIDVKIKIELCFNRKQMAIKIFKGKVTL